MRSVTSIPSPATGRATTPAFTEASPGRAGVLPAIADAGRIRRFVFGAALAGGYGLLGIVSVRLVTQGILGWWMPLAALVGVAAADLVSGIVHWAADTWGRDDFPVIGPALLVPFLVHHVNPDDFQRRRFVDVNGDVAGIENLLRRPNGEHNDLRL